MHCFAHQEKTKNSCNNGIKIVPSLVKDACTRFRVSSCLDSPSFSSEHEEESLSDIDIDYENRIIAEIKNQAMKAKAKPTNYLFTNNLEKLLKASNAEDNVEKAENDDSIEEESEVFYSVKSYLSQCSSEKENNWYKDYKGRLIWEEFLHCEGWPFGLCKKALMLPPLPASPLDSWTWSKKNIGAKV